MPDHTNTERQCFGWRIAVQSLHPDQVAAGKQMIFTVTPGRDEIPSCIQDALRMIADEIDDMIEIEDA